MSIHEGQSIEGQGINQEVLTPEQLRLREEILGDEIAGIIIGGASGTGKTKLARFLISAFGVSEEDWFLAGQERRISAGTGDEASGMIKRLPEDDEDMDQKQSRKMANARKGKLIIIESHLGPILRNIVREHNPNLPPMITLEPTAPKKVRMRWIRNRSIKDQRENIAKLEENIDKLKHPENYAIPFAGDETLEEFQAKLDAEKAKRFTLTSVTRHEDEREAGDNARFQEIYPWAKGIRHLHAPELVDDKKQRVYDIVIPVADLKLEEVPQVALAKIIGYRRAMEAETNRPVLIEDDFPRPGDSRMIYQALRDQPS